MSSVRNPGIQSPVAKVHSAPRYRLDLPLVLSVAAIVALLTAPILDANPTGGQVKGGSATITTAGNQLTIEQDTERVIIEWRNFDIPEGESTRFVQPDKDAIALNRVVTERSSRIDGRLEANGNVWLINRNGVTIGPEGEVHTHGFLATTADIGNEDFMRGNYRFGSSNRKPNAKNAKVVNEGEITLGERGLGALVAPHARNDGVIQGKLATVVIAGAKTSTVDFYGDGLINFAAGPVPVTQRPPGVDALAENNGRILVGGGRVLITANAAEGIVDHAIKVDGEIQARSISRQGGEIILDGGGHGAVAVTGTLDASSILGQGGQIDVRGHRTLLGPEALVQASGGTGGGDIRIGGDRGGQGPGRNADAVVLAAEARIIADATLIGDGGSIVIYGQQSAEIAGALTARGGPQGGNGGFIETSAAKTLTIAQATRIDASAPAGKPGTWLIDPQNITIDTDLAGMIETQLEGGINVTISTDPGTTTSPGSLAGQGEQPGTTAGDITVEASIQPGLAGTPEDRKVTFELIAARDVTINSGVTIGPANADGRDSMGVRITAGGSVTNEGTIDVSAGAGGNVSLTAAGDVRLSHINASADDTSKG